MPIKRSDIAKGVRLRLTRYAMMDETWQSLEGSVLEVSCLEEQYFEARYIHRAPGVNFATHSWDYADAVEGGQCGDWFELYTGPIPPDLTPMEIERNLRMKADQLRMKKWGQNA